MASPASAINGTGTAAAATPPALGRSPLGPALVAAALGVAAWAVGWHGTDLAAQVYRVGQVRAHGLLLWDNGWYAGNYPIAYSVVFPWIGVGLGLAATGIVSAAAAAALFDRLVTGWWERRPWGSWYFAVATVLAVAIGQLPYLTGEAFALGALLALRGRRRALGVILAVLCALCSGVDAVFLAIALGGWLLARRRADRQGAWLLAAAVLPLAAVGAVEVLFPGTGMFPYPVSGLIWVLATCAVVAAPPFRGAPAVRVAAAGYAAMAVIAFVVPSPMGGNADRLAQTAGIPVLVCFLAGPAGGRGRRWHRGEAALAAATVPFVLWQWAPGMDVVSPAARGPATTAAFYRPLVARIESLSPGPVRVEIPPTRQHWESAYVAPLIPLARGWERQLDTAYGPIFYRPGALTAASYRRWLDDQGVTYVALPSAPLDYAATAEGRLLRSGTLPYLHLVWHTRHWQLWRVTSSPGLVEGPGRLASVGAERFALSASRRGTFTVKVRYTPHWSVATGAGCVGPAPGGWTAVSAAGAGRIDVVATWGGSPRCRPAQPSFPSSTRAR